MTKKNEIPEAEVWGWFTLSMLQLGLIFYKVLLGMVTWNLFIAEHAFTVGYWQMFLIVFVFGMTFGGSGLWKLEIEARLTEAAGEKIKLNLNDAFMQTSKAYFFNTIGFGILYGIYLLI